MAKNYSGRDYDLYVGTSAPTNAFDKDDAAYTLVGKVTSLGLGQSRNSIDISSKDDGENSNYIMGRRDRDLSFGCRFDHTDNAGQAIVQSAYESESGTIHWLMSTGTASDLAYSAQAGVTQWDIQVDDESASNADGTFKVVGAVTETTLT